MRAMTQMLFTASAGRSIIRGKPLELVRAIRVYFAYSKNGKLQSSVKLSEIAMVRWGWAVWPKIHIVVYFQTHGMHYVLRDIHVSIYNFKM